jgi:hypothetical protein
VLSLGNSDAVQVGEAIYAIGNPEGLEGTFSQGIISSIRKVGADKLLQITAPISPGSSGGPVLNIKGEVIGVSVATSAKGQNLNFAIPSNYLMALLGRTGPTKPLAQANPSKTQRSILPVMDDPSGEGLIGENFTYDGTSLATGEYSFSLVNKLREPIHDISCQIVFYDLQGNPIEVESAGYHRAINSGLAKRINGQVGESVERLNNPTPAPPQVPDPPRRPKGRVDIRILDYSVGPLPGPWQGLDFPKLKK